MSEKNKKHDHKARREANKVARINNGVKSTARKMVAQADNQNTTDKRKQEKFKNLKACGIKSVFTVAEPDGSDGVYITAFGSGNEAVLEKRFVAPGPDVESLNDSKIYADYVPSASGKALFDIRTSPADIVRARAMPNEKYKSDRYNLLESIYFDTDNVESSRGGSIHVQQIYNILDMQKITAVYVNNILYALENVSGLKDNQNSKSDLFGSLPKTTKAAKAAKTAKIIEPIIDFSAFQKKDIYNDFKSFLYESAQADDDKKSFVNPRLAYFGNVFFDVGEFDNDDERKAALEKRAYWIVSLLAQLRQWVSHGDERYSWLFDLDNDANLPPEGKEFLDDLFEKRISDFNKDFIELNADRNIRVLLNVRKLKLEDRSHEAKIIELLQQFYDFIVYKEQKNLGFSLVNLREKLIDVAYEQDGLNLRDEKYDTVRHKLYSLLDFVILNEVYLNTTGTDKWCGAADEMVAKLRANSANKCKKGFDEQKDEEYNDKKAEIYKDEAKKLWADGRLKRIIKDLAQLVTPDLMSSSKLSDTDRITLNEYFKSVQTLSAKNVSYFAKLFYLVSLFLNSKEINELLTTMINKLDNIASLQGAAEDIARVQQGVSAGQEPILAGYSSNYKSLYNCNRLADDLRLVKNIARMQQPEPRAKDAMLEDALMVLGLPQEEFDRVIWKDTDSEAVKKRKKKIINFLRSNVIDSRWFLYLIRYTSAKNVRAIMQPAEGGKPNPAVRFALEQISKATTQNNSAFRSQIDRYYETCIKEIDSGDSPKQKCKKLAEEMAGLDFAKWLDDGNFKHDKDAPKEDNQEVERRKALLGLYLTVAYLIVKNLSNINARYIIANHRLELDASLLYRKDSGKSLMDNNGHWEDCCLLSVESWCDRERECRENEAAYHMIHDELAHKIRECGGKKEALKTSEGKRLIREEKTPILQVQCQIS